LASLFLAASPWPFVWYAAVIISQVLEKLFSDRFVLARTTPLPARLVGFIVALSALNSAIYVGISAYLWFCGPAGQMFAIMVICGGLLHICLHLNAVREVLVAGVIAQSAFLFGLPIANLVLGHETHIAPLIVMLIAGALYLAHLVVGVRQAQKVNQALQKANALAEQQQKLAEAASQSKSDFLATISHEIRTPMNGVIGILHLLKREALRPETRGLLDEAIGCSNMLGQIINDVLDFSKMEAGKLDLSPVPTDPAAILDSVAAIIRPQIEVKGLYLKIQADTDIGWLNIDPVRLRQCLFNTIGNAAKFTSEGGVAVRMTLIGEGDHRRLRCEIEDTGIGIPADVQGGLFDRFKQADSGTARKFGGTGLGLAISRSLARMMGGDMDFDSVEGQGSTFGFEIAAPSAEAQVETADGDLDAAPLAGLTFLVVDDNRVNRLVAVKSLEAMGAEAEAVDGGQAALDVIQVKSFDLVLMDVNMPGMDGMEATRRLRSLPGAAGQLPVIALTADVMTHHVERYRQAGMNGFVPKPIAPSQLLAEIMRLANDAPDADEAAA
jgi:signal transduction histidine kinase/CheY-like chemotaxis protein